MACLEVRPVGQLCLMQLQQRKNIRMSTLSVPVSRNLRSPFDENQGKMPPFSMVE